MAKTVTSQLRSLSRSAANPAEPFRLLAESIPQLVWTALPDGRLDYANRRWIEYTGMTAEESRGWSWKEALHPDDRLQCLDQWTTAVDQLVAMKLETRMLAADGSSRWFLVQAEPIFDQEQRPICWFGTCTDIHEQRTKQRLIEQRCQRLVEAAHDGIWEIGLDGGTLFANKRMAEMLGCSLDDLLERNVYDFIFEDDLDTAREYSLRRRNGISETFEWRWRRVDGREQWTLAASSPLVDGAGHITGAVGVFTDLTDHRRKDVSAAETTRQRLLEDVVDTVEAPVFAKDLQGRYIFSNRYHTKIRGGVQNEVLGARPDHFIASELADALSSNDRRVVEAGHSMSFRELVPIDGQVHEYVSLKTPLRDADGQIHGVFGISTPQPETTRVNEQILTTLSDLSLANQRKDEFLAMLAHELRNPLAPIRTGIELLRIAADDPDVLQETIDVMDQQSQQLVTLVDDLLDVSRIARGKIDLRQDLIDLADVIDQAVTSSRPLLDDANHEFHVEIPEGPLQVQGDSRRLVQVISNLLNNAAKYTPRGGKVDLIVQPEPNRIGIAIRDTGIGIPEHMRERIFELFTQVDKQQHDRYSGLGIGLTLVRTLVHLHDGEIQVHSDGQGQGSTFTVLLPNASSNSSPGTAAVENRARQ